MSEPLAEQPLLIEGCERLDSPGLNRFTFRLSREEFLQLMDGARVRGIPPSELVRDKLYEGGVLKLVEVSGKLTRPILPEDDEDEDEAEIERRYREALRRGRECGR